MKKIKLTIFFLLLLIPLFIFAQATKTEIQYPTVPGAPVPTATTTFPEYVKYLFNFSVIIAGVIALLVLIWGGISYITSAGDPNVISEAKNKILGAFLGLIILLSSYLVLLIINPQLVGLKMQPVEPVTGAYLIDNNGQEYYIADTSIDISSLVKNATITQIELISPTSSLIAVYLYASTTFNGNKEELTATTTTSTVSIISHPKSIYFLWNRPGIYLYDRLNFQISASTPYPVYISNNVPDLGNPAFNFDNKTQSFKFNTPAGKRYGTVLFTDLDYRGQCGYAEKLNIANLSATSTHYIHPIGTNTLSSLSVFNADDRDTGDVTFYDREDCKGNYKKYTPAIDPYVWLELGTQFFVLEGTTTISTITLDRNIRSFAINGNFGVVLNTKPLLKGRCQLFFKPQKTPCYAFLEGTDVYSPNPAVSADKPRSLIIVLLSHSNFP